MNQILNFIEKIGKRNFILIIFIFIIILITGLYQTFSLYTESEGASFVDGIKTYKFILDASNTTNSVTIAADSSKNIAITVSNESSSELSYGVYYTTTASSSDINIGYLSNSDNLPTGTISNNSSLVVTFKIDNLSSSDIVINFGLKYGMPNGGYLTLDSNQYWFEEYKELLFLNEVSPGSYVTYTGSNGCTGNACSGQNANYVSTSDMGYCGTATLKFTTNGWRVGYIENDSAYLVSAGAPECVSTYVAGLMSSRNLFVSTDAGYRFQQCSNYSFDSTTGVYNLSNCQLFDINDSFYTSSRGSYPYTCKSQTTTSCYTMYKVTTYDGTSGWLYAAVHVNYETTSGLPLHIANLDSKARTYCNTNYAYGGVCDETTTWAMDSTDYYKILGKEISACVGSSATQACGYGNDLIDNGGFYWIAEFSHSYQPSVYDGYSGTNLYSYYYYNFDWDAYNRYIYYHNSSIGYGVRPVLRLKSTIKVVGGSGTFADPYQIRY